MHRTFDDAFEGGVPDVHECQKWLLPRFKYHLKVRNVFEKIRFHFSTSFLVLSRQCYPIIIINTKNEIFFVKILFSILRMKRKKNVLFPHRSLNHPSTSSFREKSTRPMILMMMMMRLRHSIHPCMRPLRNVVLHLHLIKKILRWY